MLNKNLKVTLYSCVDSFKRIAIICMIFILFCFVISANNHESIAVETSHISNSVNFVDKGDILSANPITNLGNYSLTSAKIFYWQKYVNGGKDINFERISNFISSNPDWPMQKNMIINAEKSITDEVDNNILAKWFSKYPPITFNAKLRYLDILRDNNKSEYKEKIKEYWQENIFGNDNQKIFYKKYSAYLDKNDHKERLDLLLRNGKNSNALNIAKILGKDYIKLAKARIALSKNKTGVDNLIVDVPKSLKDNEGLLYERLKWRRKNGNDKGAIEILLNPPEIIHQSQKKKWWRERHIMIRRMLESKDYQTAYKLAITHQQDKGFSNAQALWLSGWLSLQFVNRAYEAQQYFEIMYNKVKTPTSKSRAAYWNARAYSKIGDKEKANKWYREAANYGTSFYGQLAAKKLGISPLVKQVKRKNYQNDNLINNDELLKAASILVSIGKNDKASIFIQASSKKAQNKGKQHIIADFARQLGLNHDAIFIMKRARNDNQGIDIDIAYPVNQEWMKEIDVDIEWSYIHGLIRQESAFDINAKSPAGAMGLMQLMPSTAKMVARNEKIKHKTSWLTSKHQHNIALGTSYIEELLERYDNSYILATAAYNAGPSRVDKWIKIYGDPRNKDIDKIDWIEMIPIYETRNYVQRILENLYVYRQRLKNIEGGVTILSEDTI